MTEMEQLQQDLTALGVQQGDALLVHSSMKALNTTLTPEQVIGCLPVWGFCQEPSGSCPGWSGAFTPPTRFAPGDGWPTGSLWDTPWMTLLWGPTPPLCSWQLWEAGCCLLGIS